MRVLDMIVQYAVTSKITALVEEVGLPEIWPATMWPPNGLGLPPERPGSQAPEWEPIPSHSHIKEPLKSGRPTTPPRPEHSGHMDYG